MDSTIFTLMRLSLLMGSGLLLWLAWQQPQAAMAQAAFYVADLQALGISFLPAPVVRLAASALMAMVLLVRAYCYMLRDVRDHAGRPGKWLSRWRDMLVILVIAAAVLSTSAGLMSPATLTASVAQSLAVSAKLAALTVGAVAIVCGLALTSAVSAMSLFYIGLMPKAPSSDR